MDAVLRGIFRGGRKNRALVEMEISGEGFQLDKGILSRILRAAPEKLKLAVNIESILYGQEDLSGHDGDFSWENCTLKDLHVGDHVDITEDCCMAFLKLLKNVSTLKNVYLDFWGYDHVTSLLFGRFEGAREPTEALVEMLDSNPHIESLYVSQILPEKELLCQQLKNCKKMRELNFPSLYHPEVLEDSADYEEYFEALAEVTKGRDSVLEKISYQDSGAKPTPWGPSSIEYYLALNAGGKKHIMNSTSLSGMGILQCLAPYPPNQQPNSPEKWAYSAEEQEYKDICVIYGLLRESPGTWSKLAVESCYQSECKPAASLSAKRQAVSMETSCSKKKLRPAA